MGGPRAAFGRYDMDYWGNCVLEAVRWSATQAERARMPVVVTANAWEIAVADASRFRSLGFQLRQRGGYHLDIRLLKGSRDDVIGTSGLPDILYRVTTADGTPLCVVLPDPSILNWPRAFRRRRRVRQSMTSDDELQARTIADFGEQWTSYPDSERILRFGRALQRLLQPARVRRRRVGTAPGGDWRRHRPLRERFRQSRRISHRRGGAVCGVSRASGNHGSLSRSDRVPQRRPAIDCRRPAISTTCLPSVCFITFPTRIRSSQRRSEP